MKTAPLPCHLNIWCVFQGTDRQIIPDLQLVFLKLPFVHLFSSKALVLHPISVLLQSTLCLFPMTSILLTLITETESNPETQVSSLPSVALQLGLLTSSSLCTYYLQLCQLSVSASSKPSRNSLNSLNVMVSLIFM